MILLFQTPTPRALLLWKVILLFDTNEIPAGVWYYKSAETHEYEWIQFSQVPIKIYFHQKKLGSSWIFKPFWYIIITWHFHVAGCRFYEIACPLVFQRCLPSFPLPHVEVKPTRVIFLVVYSPFGSSVEPRYIVWFL